MKNRIYSIPAKMTAIVLFLGALLGILCFGGMTAYNVADNAFEGTEEGMWQKTVETLVLEDNQEMFERYYLGEHIRNSDLVNYSVEIYDENGVLVEGKKPDGAVLYTREDEFDYWTGLWSEDGQDYSEEYKTVRVVGSVTEPLVGNDRYSAARQLVSFCYRMRYPAIVLTIIFLGAAVALFVYLMCSAGRRSGKEEVVLNRGTDRIPFDVYTVLCGLALAGILGLVCSLWGGPRIWKMVLCAALVVAGGLLFLMYAMSFMVRIKLGVLLRRTLLWRIGSWIRRCFRGFGRWTGSLLRAMPLLWQTVLVLTVISLVELFALAQAWYADEIVALWFVEKLIIVPFILWIVLMMRRLQAAGKELAEGRLDTQIETKYLIGPFREHAKNLNSIQEGITKAVDARMKSEHFKTELITNVSHDIKTPLTSIINYVNLIKKEDPQDETLKGYVEVLDRQSVRLKKLIEDLVEASKASTGNLAVNMAPCEVGVLLGQAAAEYEEKLCENHLDLQLRVPEEPITILADGRHLWRVFDNLLNNICKYSQPQTRVYLNLEERDGKARITFRNISKYALNISSDELMERFVRGDSSRHTEGSGLGLSIARSLVELQHGTIDLIVDGDLFKVILTFQTV